MALYSSFISRAAFSRFRVLNRCQKLLNRDWERSLHTTVALKSGEDIPPVSRYSIPERNTLPDVVRERMDSEEEKAGFLANVFKVFSRRPEEFNAFMQYYDLLMGDREGSSLTRAEKELIVTATSARVGCLYCTVAHGAVHRIYSKRPRVAEQVSINLEFAELTPRERAILDFALRVSAMEPITEEDIGALAEHGLDREDVWDIGAVTAFFAMSNRYAHFAAMTPNIEFYTIGRVPKSKK